MTLFAMVKASELGNDWRAERHIRVEGLPLFMYQRLQEIKRIRDDYLRRIAKLDDEERAIIAQRKEEDGP